MRHNINYAEYFEEKVTALTSENELLKMQLLHKEELLAVHNYYIKQKMNN